LNVGEWRLLIETHNPTAGRNGSSPPSPAAPLGRRPPDSLSLPLINPIASCYSRQDEDGVCIDPTRQLNQKSKSAWKHEKRQAQQQADKQRSESAPDLFLDGLEDVLDGAFMVVDAFDTYPWTPERSLWMPVRAHVMMVDASNHSGWDPPRPHNRLDQGSRDRAEVRAFVITRAGTATGGPHFL